MSAPEQDPRIWVLADPRAGTAAQALGIAERLEEPFRTVPLAWGPLARLAIPWPSLLGLTAASRRALRDAALEGPWARMSARLEERPGIPRVVPAWPELVVSAGRRSAPVSRWLRRRGARTVHCMRPGPGAGDFDLLVIGRHDPVAAAPNVMPVLGATHRLSPAALRAARERWPELAALPRPRVALLLGGPVAGRGGGAGMAPAEVLALLGQVLPAAGSLLASTSRRTGDAAGAALAAGLAGVPGRLYRWGEGGANPYPGFLALADAVVAPADSVSMLSEALATAAPVFVTRAAPDAPRHRALRDTLLAAGLAAPVEAFPRHRAGFPARPPLDETARVAAAIRGGLLAPR